MEQRNSRNRNTARDNREGRGRTVDGCGENVYSGGCYCKVVPRGVSRGWPRRLIDEAESVRYREQLARAWVDAFILVTEDIK